MKALFTFPLPFPAFSPSSCLLLLFTASSTHKGEYAAKSPQLTKKQGERVKEKEAV